MRRFDPYGVPITGDGGQPYGYSGEWWDAETQLLYLRARYLRPELGQFLTRDPWPGDVRQPGTLNGYSYGFANPLRYTDPNGHNPIAWCLVGGFCEQLALRIAQWGTQAGAAVQTAARDGVR